jgi:hypothetical protein
MNAQQILEQLTEAYARRDLLKMEQNEARDVATPAEVKVALAEIDYAYSAKLDPLENLISDLESDAKAAVLSEGATVKGGALQAVFTKGRVSWDSKMLDGLTIVIPELNQARKVGEPSVSIRKIG